MTSKIWYETQRVCLHLLLFSLAIVVALPTWALGAKGGIPNNGNGLGSVKIVDENPGNGNDNGNSTNSPWKGELYGDLYVIDRDVDGVPLLYSWISNGDDTPIFNSSPAPGDALFEQPITVLNADDCALFDPVGVCTDGLYPFACEDLFNACNMIVSNWWPSEDSLYDGDLDVHLLPLDSEGAIFGEYQFFAYEVDLGRLSFSKSPKRVLDRAFAEVVSLLTQPDIVSIGTDPAGRVLITKIDESTKVIDSPLECLAIYRELISNRSLTFSGITIPAPFEDGTYLDAATSMLGAAIDKDGQATVDATVFINTVLGINFTGDVEYFSYAGFTYDRKARYAAENNAKTICYGEYFPDGTATLHKGKVMDVVFGNQEIDGTNISGFVMAADDARAIIYFMHTYPITDEWLEMCADMPVEE